MAPQQILRGVDEQPSVLSGFVLDTSGSMREAFVTTPAVYSPDLEGVQLALQTMAKIPQDAARVSSRS